MVGKITQARNTAVRAAVIMVVAMAQAETTGRARVRVPGYGQNYGSGYQQSYGSGSGQSFDRYSGRSDYGRGEERGFLSRAGDEVRSWLGDDAAERRRRQDARNSGYGMSYRQDYSSS